LFQKEHGRCRDNSKTERGHAMTAQEFITYQEQTFDSYAMKLIHNEGADAKKELSRRAKREVPLSALSGEQLVNLCTEDKYTREKRTLYVRDQEVSFFDTELAQALSQLPPKWREILLFYITS